jgi:hypothetical protein
MTHFSSRVGLSLLALALCGVGGCRWLLETTPEKMPIQPPPLQVTTRVQPVHAEEITPSNARGKAQSLLEEIEQDSGKE